MAEVTDDPDPLTPISPHPNPNESSNQNTQTLPHGSFMSEASTKSLTKSLHNSLTRTNRIAQPPETHVTECSNVFYAFNVIISMVYPALYMLEACLQHLMGYESDVRPQWGLYSENGIANLHNLYIVTIMPIAIVAMALSCAAKPRRNDLPFMITLNLQYFVFALGSEVFFVIRESGSPAAVKSTVIRSFIWLLVRSLGLRLRSAIANLPDPELSHFLTYSVFVGGITGLLQLAFLMFSSIQCDISMTNYENQSWRECKRTTYSQTGVGVMVAFFIMLKIIAGVIPKKVLAKHFVSIRQIISMNLNFLEFLQCLCISISSFCLLFLLANYGAEGDFKNENEASFFYNMTIVGVSFQMLPVLISSPFILKETREQRSSTSSSSGAGAEDEDEGEKPEKLLTESSRFWLYFGLTAVTLHSTIDVISAWQAYQESKSSVFSSIMLNNISTITLPICILLFSFSVLSKPRQPERTRVARHVGFVIFAVVGEGSMMATSIIKNGFSGTWWTHIVRFGLFAVVYITITIKIESEDTKNLNDVDTDDLLVKRLFRGGFQCTTTVLFVTFRVTKCWTEQGTLDEGFNKCGPSAAAGVVLSMIIFGVYILQLIHGSVESSQRKKLSISIERVALMRINWARIFEGTLGVAIFVTSMMLFTILGNPYEGDMYNFVVIVGGIGCVSMVAFLTIEIRYIMKVLKGERASTAETELAAAASTSLTENVTEMSWFFDVIGVLVPIGYTCSTWGYAAVIPADDLSVVFGFYAYLSFPLAASLFVLSFFAKPRRQDRTHKAILHLNFFVFIIVGLTLDEIVRGRQGQLLYVGVLRFAAKAGCCCFLLWENMWLRNKAAKLSDGELTRFLCDSLLTKGSGILAPLFFFCCETLTCASEIDFEIGNYRCANSVASSSFLSGYLLLLLLQTISMGSVKPRVREAFSVTYEDLAAFRLQFWQKLQFLLSIGVMICSLFLFSTLGADAEPMPHIKIVGYFGASFFLIEYSVHLVMLRRTEWHLEKGPRDAREFPRTQMAFKGVDVIGENGVSMRKLNENMVLGSLV